MENLLYDENMLCVRCGRPKTIQNMKHSRLYGRMCMCGSQEWRQQPNMRVQSDVAFCTCSVFIPSSQSTALVCSSCGKPQRG